MAENNIVSLRQTPDAEPPPHNIDVEQALLGALMQRNAGMAEIAASLKPEHFFVADHQEVFSAIANLVAQGVPAVPMTLKGYLKPQIAGVSAMQYLARIYQAATTADAAGYARIVRSFAARRTLLSIGEDLVSRARFDPLETPGTSLLDDIEGELLLARAEMPEQRQTSMTAGQGAAWMLERVRGLREGLLQSTAVSSGLSDLDRVTMGGFQRGQLWLLAARPGMGKTVAMTSLSRNAARENGVIVFQCEVTRDQQWARYLADLSYIQNRPLTFGQIMAGTGLSDEDLWRLEDAEKRLGRLHLRVDCEPSISLAQITFAVKAEKKALEAKGLRLGVVFIDYLKFIKVSDRYRGNRVLEIGEISGSLKQLAKSEDICIVLLTQLNRQTDAQGREDKRPTLADLRDSGELEQDADCVLFLYRDAYYLERKLKSSPNDTELIDRMIQRQHALEIILGKNRAGPCVTVDAWCDVSASSIAQSARGLV